MGPPIFQPLVEEADIEHADLESTGLMEELMPMQLEAGSAEWQVASRLKFAWKLWLGVSALLVVALCLVHASSLAIGRGPSQAKIEASQGLFGGAAYETVVQSLQMAGQAGSNMESLTNFVETTNFTQVTLTLEAIRNRTAHLLGLTGYQLKRDNDMRDGNPCPDDEEFFFGLCYKRCANLTEGRYPIRTTAFSCCMQEPCSIFNSKFSSLLKPCHGMNVGGHYRYGCPHSPGDCLLNEELHLGNCYKKCSVLTDSEYPYRSTAATCCKYNTLVDCFDATNTLASANFSVGGGLGDELLEEEMGKVHPPVPALAEEQTTTTLPTVPPLPTLPTAPPLPALPSGL